MTGRALPRVTRRGRLWPDRHPLRRTCDRAEAVMVAGLLTAFLVGAPLLALTPGTGHIAPRSAPSTLSAPCGTRLPRSRSTARRRQPPAGVQWWDLWPGRGGPRRMARGAPAGFPRLRAPGPGQRCQCGSASRGGDWPTADRLPGGEPGDPRRRGCPPAWGMLLLGSGVLAHRVLDRRRLSAWDAEWRATGRRWTSPR